jgi:hypothetical protein
MQTWQFGLSKVDEVLLFLHTMGFVSQGNQLQLDDLFDHYGRSATTEGIHRVERGIMRASYELCEVFDIQITTMPQQMRINSPADLQIKVADREGVRQYGAKETEYALKYDKWSRKYLCNELGSVELSANQVVRLVRILSELNQHYLEWKSYMD